MASFRNDLIEDEVQIHLILIGSSGVGKTSLRKHLKNEQIDMNEVPTIIMEPDHLYGDARNVSDNENDHNLMGNKISLTMWDTGGQPIFQDLLPCFARLKCMYGIIFRMSDLDEFDSKPEIRPCDAYHEPVMSPFSSRDIVYRNLAYFQAFSASAKDNLENLPWQVQQDQGSEVSDDTIDYPSAVVVGTCKDVVIDSDQVLLEEGKKELDKGIQEFVDANGMSVYSINGEDSSFIHEVNNTASGLKTDPGIKYLRKNIAHCAQNSSMKIKQSWKMFKVRLHRLCYTDYVNCGVIPLGEAISIGKECNVDDPKAALMYFHEVGTFMWYHMSEKKSMTNFVVIHPKMLLQVLSVLFCYNPSSLPEDLKCLMNSGIMTVSFFKNLLEQKACSIDDSWFLSFLEEHHLSIKVTTQREEDCYFFPSLLTVYPEYECNLDDLKSDVSPLYIVPQSGYIATGMFTRLLTALAGVWKVPLQSTHIKLICRNQFEFVLNESIRVVLSELSKSIRVDCFAQGSHKLFIKEDLYFNVISMLNVHLQ